MHRNTAIGFGVGVAITLALVKAPFNSAPAPAAEIDPPDVIGGPRSAGASVEPIGIDLGDWQAWFIHTENGYRQVAFNMPGQPGVLVGELYDDAGNKVGQGAVFERERENTSISDIERLSSWVSRDFVDPPSVPEVQSVVAGQVQSTPRYLVVDPFSEPARRMATQIRALVADGVRIIPAATAGAGSFDGLHAVMEGGSHEGQSTLSATLSALEGETLTLQSKPGESLNEHAFMAFSKNISLQSVLGIETLPAMIQQDADGKGVIVEPLRRTVSPQE